MLFPNGPGYRSVLLVQLAFWVCPNCPLQELLKTRFPLCAAPCQKLEIGLLLQSTFLLELLDLKESFYRHSLLVIVPGSHRSLAIILPETHPLLWKLGVLNSSADARALGVACALVPPCAHGSLHKFAT